MTIKKKRRRQIPTEVTTEREKQVWSLRQSMWTQERIAKELKISQPAVAKILKRMSERYSTELMDDIKKVKAEQVMQLDRMADELMQAWERSKLPSKSTWFKRTVDAQGKPLDNSLGERTDEAKNQEGDPRYLSAAMKAKEDIRKIIGADAPVKTFALTKDVSSLTDEQLQDIVNGRIPTD